MYMIQDLTFQSILETTWRHQLLRAWHIWCKRQNSIAEIVKCCTGQAEEIKSTVHLWTPRSQFLNVHLSSGGVSWDEISQDLWSRGQNTLQSKHMKHNCTLSKFPDVALMPCLTFRNPCLGFGVFGKGLVGFFAWVGIEALSPKFQGRWRMQVLLQCCYCKQLINSF